MVFLYIKRVKANDIMITVNLTEQQLSLMEQLVGEKFSEVAQAWLPADETKDMNKLCYNTLLNLRCVRMSKEFDETYGKMETNGILFDKKEYLRDVGLVTDEELAQQGIS
jgi:hypothetical protein